MWTDSAQGAVIAWEGTYDEKARVLTWKAPLATGMSGAMRWTFPSEDRMEMNLEIKSGFVPVFFVTNSMTRKK
jgi:hypothetical protein